MEAREGVAGIFDKAAAKYDRAPFPFFTPFGEALVQFAELDADERVLDAGCGTGAALIPALRVAGDVVGVDLSPAMLERAREEAPGAELIVGDVCALPFEDASFDVVLSAFVVFFPEDPAAALREAARVLRSEGRLVIATWAENDERWSFERDLRREFASQIEPAVLARIGPALDRLNRFNEPAKVEAELRGAGLEPAATQTHEIEFRFADEEAWWEFTSSHAGRAALDALPEAAREELRERTFEQMRERVRADDGTFPRTYTAIFASATAPSR
jgi:ubiquinone/menaquinone biosynthesis C-methylase UbiE